jgi:trehalose/maltose transport system substrate-binding protein
MERSGVAILLATSMATAACGPAKRTPAERVTLSFFRLGWSQPDEGPAAQRLSQEFTRRTGIAVTHPPVPETSLSQLELSHKFVREGDPTVDVLGVDIVWSGVLGSDLLDLAPHFAEELAATDPQLVPAYTVNGRLVAVPYQVHVGVLEYRTDLLREYGFDHPPRTWSELETMAQAIQTGERAKGQKDFWGYVWQGAAAEALTCNGLEWQAAEGAGPVIEADGSISVNNPATVRSWQRARSWIGRISPPSVVAYHELDSRNVFDSGRAAFNRNWVGAARGAAIAPDGATRLYGRSSPMADRFGYAGMPGGPGGRFSMLGGSGLAVPSRSPHPKEAIELIRYLLRDQTNPSPPPDALAPVLFDLPQVLDGHAGPYKSALATRPSIAAGRFYEPVTRAYVEALHSVLTGAELAPAAAARLETQLVEITGFKIAPGN